MVFVFLQVGTCFERLDWSGQTSLDDKTITSQDYFVKLDMWVDTCMHPVQNMDMYRIVICIRQLPSEMDKSQI